MLDQIRVVLVGTSHSGNIGSAARAMKVMGLTNMTLVAPGCEVDGQAIALAAGASDIANNARVVNTLEDAVADCGLVIGTSARSRTLEWPMLDARACGQKAIQEAATHPVAIVFGRERTGLTNEELQTCHYHVSIPSNPDYSSLNLAMAVQTLCYEMRVAWLDSQAYQGPSLEQEYPLNQDLARFLYSPRNGSHQNWVYPHPAPRHGNDEVASLIQPSSAREPRIKYFTWCLVIGGKGDQANGIERAE